ncbi:MAG TPA: hypothetical protein PLA68_07020 [Panacibacter sp.]|nr:hypothetical protein [Panacibacter sp.]
MEFLIKGNLRGFLCGECIEAISGAEVLLYLPWQQNRILENTVASTKDTFRTVSNEEKDQRTGLLVAKAITDEAGNFSFSVDEKFSKTAFDIDFICGTLPHGPRGPRREVPQFHLTTFYPQWRIDEKQQTYYYSWQYNLPAKIWCFIRGYYYDSWVICGRLTNCETGQPVEGANVTAFDADLITDDLLGTVTTDVNGNFQIYYTSADFRVNFIPFNIETDIEAPFVSSGPDVYFKAEIGGVTLVDETSADRRRNVDYCLCVNLCTNINIVPGEGGNIPSAWTKIGSAFYIPTGFILNDFDTAGYAGAAKYALTQTIDLTGQAAHKRANGNYVEYRFLVSDVTTANGGAAPALANFTKIIGVTPNLFVPSVVATIRQQAFPNAVHPVISDQSDFDAEGWFDVNSAIERTRVTFGIPLADINNWDFIDDDTLLSLNTAALTTQPNVPLNAANAGQPIPAVNKIAIEKVAIRFEIREVINKATNTFASLLGTGQTLNSMVINNNPIFAKYSVAELETLGDCSPLNGTVHAKYTVYHPHLQSASINVHSNGYAINKNLMDGFITLAANTNAAVDGGNNNSLQINASPNDLIRCTYILTFDAQFRMHTGNGQVYNSFAPLAFFYDI